MTGTIIFGSEKYFPGEKGRKYAKEPLNVLHQ